MNLSKNKKIWILLLIGIGIASFVRFFYGITGDYFTFLDEYPTFDVAAGFTKTGKFYFWDFHTSRLTDVKYTRAWPHTILLMIWFKIFGITVVNGKILSAVFGVLFVLSVFYMTKKIYNDYYISIVSSIILMVNPTVIEIFRQIRMYSLWLLVITWLFYFVFLAFSSGNNFIKNNRVSVFIKQSFDFSIKYIILAILILILAYNIHINTLASGIGILLFFVYCLVFKKENKYFTAFALIVIVTLLFYFCCMLYVKIGGPHWLGELYWWLFRSGNITIREDANIRYWYWIQDFLGHRNIFWISILMIIIAFLKNVRKRNKAFDFSVYCVSIVVSSVYCFVYILSRYYQARYMIYVTPLFAIVTAWGLIETLFLFQNEYVRKILLLVYIGCLGISVVYNFDEVYHNEKICYHKQVYQIVKNDAGEETVAIAGFSFRDYYGIQVFDDYVTVAFDRENDMEILKEFANSYPDGYVIVESAKINGFPEVIKKFIQNYSERIAGEGIDKYNIEVVRYHFLKKTDSIQENKVGNVVKNGPIEYSFENKGGKTDIRINVDSSKIEEGATILFLNFGVFTDNGETKDKYFQLLLPQDKKDDIFTFRANIDMACQVVLLKDECMVYYEDGTCKEKLIYEE